MDVYLILESVSLLMVGTGFSLALTWLLGAFDKKPWGQVVEAKEVTR